ncbi:DNA phosphorothioation-dependent restriction protein DptH [Bacillus sp. Y1]|nr:DNA phosphorothioation-dependent restriction protein DptH [Bacillus sp. Y1]AYA76012.1 DNA phosphorothioation-dependent restriction protein DptH [Bacillus sp. Y1]
MSNQFYNYIVHLLFNYFKEAPVKAGDRYYLHLDKDEDVQEMIHALKEQDHVTDFVYQHELGDPYKTFSFKINELKVVVASTSEAVKPDFLVTLRNQVGEQKGVWENTALLSIVSEQLDSILGGSSDLQKEGMPLHPNSLYLRLKDDIDNSGLNKVEKIILLDNIERLVKEQTFQQITFFDFEDIFITLSKGKIDSDDYKKFGLFKDEDLSTFTGNRLKERMNQNRDLFDYVRKVHDFGIGGVDDLEKRFSPDGANKLKQEQWFEEPFSQVNKYHEDYISINKKTKVLLKEINVKDSLKYWDRPEKETAAGERKRHLIIFNPTKKEEVNLQLSFSFEGGKDKSLSKDYFKVQNAYKNLIKENVAKTNITVSISADKVEPTFVKLAYRHDNKAALGAELSIVVLPIAPEFLEPFRTNYLINSKLNCLEINTEEEELKFGQGYNRKVVEVLQNNQEIAFEPDEQLVIVPQSEAFNDEDELQFKIRYSEAGEVVPFLLKNELPESTPITGLRIWKLKREKQRDFELINNRLVFGNTEYYFHAEYKQFFNWEANWLEQGLRCARLDAEELIKEDLNLGEELRESYSRYITYFKTTSSIPSLCYLNTELETRAKDYVKAYLDEIKSFDEHSEAGSKGRDLFKLGTVIGNNIIYFTPFHPLIVAYQLMVHEELGNEEVDNSILNRLTPESLVPYIYIYNNGEQLYKSDYQQTAVEWMAFKPVNQVSVSDANQYLAKVIEDKLIQFEEHFNYLFIEKSKAPLQVNVINISNDKEVLKGIISWMLKRINSKGVEALKRVEVTLYNEQHDSAFDLFSRIESIDQFEESFNIKLKVKDMEPTDILRIIREKLSYFKKDHHSEYKYAHISFYKMHAQENYALQPMFDMNSGITLEGLYSSLSSMKGNENYRSGFGVKAYSIEDENLLTQTAFYINELAANLRNEGNDTYRKGEAIFSRTTTTDEKTLEQIYKSSYWVTFIDPSVDLAFFNDYEKNLVVIHYSDQYSSSNRYDAITVTDKSQQYYAVIKEFLKLKDVEGTDENVNNTIKAFNTFNGEWLLRIIGSKGHYSREKLSIVSAIKFALSYFDHKNILWVPISLEEVLRVAGAVGLSKSEGVFTAKNLGVKGSHSDDLLLLGLEQINDQLKLHFYPIEVKIGANKNDVLDKAKKQVRHTKKLFKDALSNQDDGMFTSKFYRNFFVQLFISNAKKLEQSTLWESKNYSLSDEVLERLYKDQYVVSDDLENYIGEGAILSFQRDAYYRSSYLDEGITLLGLTETDGYLGLVQSIDDMHKWIQIKESDFVKESLLSYIYDPMTQSDNRYEKSLQKLIDPSEVYNEESVAVDISPEPIQGDTELPEEEQIDPIPETAEDNSGANLQIETARILLGKAENSNREIYWEYGNKGLANRHLLISGKSGQGKTYFMQCLLLEKSKLGIPSIVIDYTEGFLPNQLEAEFVNYMGNKLKQKIVFSDQLPINPFQKNVRDIGGITLPESNTDVAERIKSVFAAVYSSLGIQQLNAIYEATLNGVGKYGDEMSLLKLRDELEEDGSSYSKTALSQIRPLIDRNPFTHINPIQWNDIVESNGEVFIIQLTGYPRDVQLIITEFILWDLWNYSVRFGNKNKPMPVILDEAQNLDHTEKSPSARILTEGRKFGWSAWYATQFLKSQLDSDELARLQNSSQKIYFSPPEQEISSIASSLANDQTEKKQWEKRLSELKKGQCIVHGPILSSSGELSKPTVTVVDILPLSERL